MKSNLNAIKINYEDTHIITCFFHLIQSWWRKANKFHLRNKNYKENTKELIANLKLLPFLDNKNMKLFYNEIKKQNKFKDEFYGLFFNYMEKTWIGIEEKKNKTIRYVKPEYSYEIWGYHDKIDMEDSRANNLEKYIGFCNNACESINSYLRTMIPLNQKLSVNYFSRIVSTLFLKFEYKRTRNEINQERHIIIERLVTDNLLDLVNLNINNKYLDKEKLK